MGDSGEYPGKIVQPKINIKALQIKLFTGPKGTSVSSLLPGKTPPLPSLKQSEEKEVEVKLPVVKVVASDDNEQHLLYVSTQPQEPVLSSVNRCRPKKASGARPPSREFVRRLRNSSGNDDNIAFDVGVQVSEKGNEEHVLSIRPANQTPHSSHQQPEPELEPQPRPQLQLQLQPQQQPQQQPQPKPKPQPHLRPQPQQKPKVSPHVDGLKPLASILQSASNENVNRVGEEAIVGFRTKLSPSNTSRGRRSPLHTSDGSDNDGTHHYHRNEEAPERIQRYHSSADIKLSSPSRKDKTKMNSGLARSHTRTDLSEHKVGIGRGGHFMKGGGREWRGGNDDGRHRINNVKSISMQIQPKSVLGKTTINKQTSVSTPQLSQTESLSESNKSFGRDRSLRQDSFDRPNSLKSEEKHGSFNSPMSTRRMNQPSRSAEAPPSRMREDVGRTGSITTTVPESPVLGNFHRTTAQNPTKGSGRDDDELLKRFQQMQRKKEAEDVGSSRESLGSTCSAGKMETIPVMKYQKIETSDYFNYKKTPSDNKNDNNNTSSITKLRHGASGSNRHDGKVKSSQRNPWREGGGNRQVTYVPYVGSEQNINMNMNPRSPLHSRSSSFDRDPVKPTGRVRRGVFK